MIDPPRIANLLSAGQHDLNYFVRKRKIKCVCKCVCIYVPPRLRKFLIGLQFDTYLLLSIPRANAEKKKQRCDVCFVFI